MYKRETVSNVGDLAFPKKAMKMINPPPPNMKGVSKIN